MELVALPSSPKTAAQDGGLELDLDIFSSEFDLDACVVEALEEGSWPNKASPPPCPAGATAANAPSLVSPMLLGTTHRCVDPLHASPCPWCTAAPSLETEAEYELVGDPGKKNGEKRLRSMLTKTPEWNSIDERYRLATTCDAQGLSQLASVLRNKGCSSLRKTHLMHLARSWGYACDLWCRREDRRTHIAKMDKAREAVATRPQPLAPVKTKAQLDKPPLVGSKRSGGGSLYPTGRRERQGKSSDWPAGGATPMLMLPRAGAARSTAGGIAAWAVDVRSGPPDATPLGAPGYSGGGEEDARAPLAAIASHIQLALRPLATESARCFAGFTTAGQCAPACSSGDLHGQVLSAAEWLRDIAHDMDAALNSLRARAATLPAATAATVAWLQLLGRACPLEDGMLRLQQGLHAATMQYTQSNGDSPAQMAWPEDMVQGALMGLELVARCQSLATQSKFTSYGTYVKVTVQLKALMADFTAEVANNLLIRSAQLAPLRAIDGGEGWFVDSAEAASLPTQAGESLMRDLGALWA